MEFDDFLEDAKLHIETTGRDASCETANVRAYEPTSYSVLERILEEGGISSADHLIDYGSGKGRVCIFFSDRTGCRAAGFSDEIDCKDLFSEEDDRNRVMIFEMGQDLQ